MLTPDGYKARLIENRIDRYMKSFGAVCIEGPKYCGKTWTSLSKARSVAYIGSPERNFQMRTMAELSPDLVLEGDYPRLIDEWQEVPSLWDAVRFTVDMKKRKGMYILTGSATPNHKGILHSGTGRISKVQMDTMSLYESGESSGEISLRGLFDGTMNPAKTNDVSLNRLIYLAVRGGWPGNLEASEETCKDLATEYLKTVVDDDVYKVDGIRRDSRKMRSLLTSLGRNVSTIVSNATLRRDMAAKDEIAIDPDTISDYLDVFSRLFLIYEQPAFNTHLRSSRRILKSPKRHFIDPSLAAAAIHATPQMLYQDLNTFGFIFESMCIRDLKIYSQYHEGQLFHFRDEKGNEADAVVQFNDGTWGAIEIKLGTNQIDQAAHNLLKLKTIMQEEGDNPPKVLAVICGMSNLAYQREDGVFVIPITALRP